MKNVFIQSFMNGNGETSLEVIRMSNFMENKITSKPTNFDVAGNGSIWISIDSKDWHAIKDEWDITIDQVQESLQEQFMTEHGSSVNVHFSINK